MLSARRSRPAGWLAHLATVDPDGSPQASLIWVGLEGDLIVSGHLSRSRKVAHLQRDPRLVLTIEAEGRAEHGLDRYLLIHGRAQVVERSGPVAAASGPRLPGH